MTDDARDPERRLNRVQAECYEAEELLDRAQDGLAPVGEDEARRVYEAKTRRYLRELHRFRSESQAKEMWTEPVAHDTQGEKISLESLHAGKFGAETNLVGGEVTTTRAQSLPLGELKKIVDQLDTVFHALGIDIETEDPRPRYGYEPENTEPRGAGVSDSDD
jgi:hypothetical protein